MRIFSISFTIVLCGLIAVATATTAQVTCVRDEQRGCFTFQIVGVQPHAGLIREVSAMSARAQVRDLGHRVLSGMKTGQYQASRDQGYYLVLWMTAEWGNRPLPADRIRQVCYSDLHGGKTYYRPHGRSLVGIPTIRGVGQAHTALNANCPGGVGAGWIIPNDVAQHIAFAMVCADGVTHYPFWRNGRQEGIVHSGEEVQWYLGQGWVGVISVAVWQR